jgi:hypothetical protein
MVKKQGGKIACGQCHKFFNEDELILDEQNNRYLCDGCYEPRDTEEIDKGDVDDGPCEIDDPEEEPGEEQDQGPLMKRGEARIERNARSERARPIKRESKKSLISW